MNFKNYVRMKNKEIMAMGVNCANSEIKNVSKIVHKTICNFGSCKIKFEERPRDLYLSVIDPKGNTLLDRAVSLTEYAFRTPLTTTEEWDKFKKAYISTFVNYFEITLNDSNEATISIDDLR